ALRRRQLPDGHAHPRDRRGRGSREPGEVSHAGHVRRSDLPVCRHCHVPPRPSSIAPLINGSVLGDELSPAPATQDALFGGSVVLFQPPRGAGYRTNVDALLLAGFATARKVAAVA